MKKKKNTNKLNQRACEDEVRPPPVSSNWEYISHQAPDRLDDPRERSYPLIHLSLGRHHSLHILPVVVGRHFTDGTAKPLADAIHGEDPIHKAPVHLLREHAEPVER